MIFLVASGVTFGCLGGRAGPKNEVRPEPELDVYRLKSEALSFSTTSLYHIFTYLINDTSRWPSLRTTPTTLVSIISFPLLHFGRRFSEGREICIAAARFEMDSLLRPQSRAGLIEEDA